jgi:hypothetical protein
LAIPALFPLMHKLKLITRFYSGIFLANFLVSLSCVFLLWSFGSKAHDLLGILFWYKVISMVMVFYLAVHYKSRELYYYQNLGVSKLTLGLSTSAFDFALWLAIFIGTYKII